MLIKRSENGFTVFGIEAKSRFQAVFTIVALLALAVFFTYSQLRPFIDAEKRLDNFNQKMRTEVLQSATNVSPNLAPFSAQNIRLTLEANGCEAKLADGKPFKIIADPANGKFHIPKGTTFTGECFSP